MFEGLLHDLLPELVHLEEPVGLLRQLFLDIISIEDVLEVDPLSLAGQPFL